MLGQEVNDAARLADLEETGLLDVEDDPSFNRFVRLASRMLEVPIAKVSLVSNKCQHFVGGIGLPVEDGGRAETPLSQSICRFVVTSGAPLVIDDAEKDERFREICAVADGRIGAYLGVPIVSSLGNILGSFCVMHSAPRKWEEDELAFMEDLRSAVCAEIELRRQTKRLEATVSELEQSYARNDEMIHMIIHDLRNPLSGIIGGMELFRSNEDRSEEDEEVISIVEESCQQMEDLIGNILETSKIRSASVPLQISSFALAPLLEDLQGQAELMGGGKSIKVHWEMEEGIEHCSADRRLLKRVLQNLLNNAVKFTPKGGDIYFSASSVEGGERIAFSISDSGSGVPEKEKESIFGKYVVGKVSSPKSIGLGLAFCRLVAEAHGGTICVKDGLNQVGSTFVLELPKVLKE